MAACSAYPGPEFTGVSLKKEKSYKISGGCGSSSQCPENLLSKLSIQPVLLSLWALLCGHRLVGNYLLDCWVLIILPQNCHFIETDLNIKCNSFVVIAEVVP